MSNFEYNTEPDKKELRIREKQCKCNHTYFKCPQCGLYKDNLFNEYKAQIDILETLLDIDEQLLLENGVGYISLKELDIWSIINNMIEEKKRQYHSARKGLLDEV